MKTLVWGGFFVGSSIGSAVPLLWDSSFLSFSSILCSTVGGILGIFAGYWLGKSLGA